MKEEHKNGRWIGVRCWILGEESPRIKRPLVASPGFLGLMVTTTFDLPRSNAVRTLHSLTEPNFKDLLRY